ncbi:MAG: prepilin-type N-terminal cleavage/methylation domain-containing protein [Elusimicrobiaceae bacterium]|nr:prepilin-type N-terminal cleavage/methylation domain-containing protein [Elusimicrobiaceae bacterium]
MVQQKQAFTLIELLVVVLIIGILAAVALPQYQIAVGKARTMQAIVTLRAIANVQETYYLANGDYSDSLSALDIEISNDDNFRYSCVDKRYCAANALKDTLPDISFHLLHQPANRKGDSGIRYCSTYNMTGSHAKQAERICNNLGTKTSTVGYYLLN